jgi:hypothetical protein
MVEVRPLVERSAGGTGDVGPEIGVVGRPQGEQLLAHHCGERLKLVEPWEQLAVEEL